ncbi:MAG: hypothetical protein LIO75_07900, partial [Lachnospiraceae bacterium]|nr:hypothetical protein [Lachnospiraceae bacterium]
DGERLHAASLTCHDWSGVAQNLSWFYSWGYSLLLTIPFLISDNIYTMYKIAVIINVVLCSLIVPLSYSMGKRIAPNMSRNALLFISLIVSLYSTYILESAVSLAETLIYFLAFLILWLLWRYMETRQWIWGILCGLAVGYIYTVHNRCIGFVIAYAVIAAVLLVREKDLKQLLIMILPLAGMLLLKYGVTQWLDAAESTVGVYTQNTYGTMTQKVTTGLTLYSLISAVCSALGSCWYMLAGTFLTAGLGILAILKGGIFRKDVPDRQRIFYIYAVVSWLFMLAVSVAGTYRKAPLTEGRTDIYYYGRYMEAAIGFFIFMGLIWLWRKGDLREKLREIAGCFLVFLCLSLLVYYVTASYTDTGDNLFSVVAILFPFFYPTLTISVKASSIMAAAVSALILYLFLLERKRYRYLGAVVLCGTFLFVGYSATYSVAKSYIDQASVTNRPTANADFNDVCAWLEASGTESFYVLSSEATEAFSFQMVLNKKTVVSLTDAEQLAFAEAGEYVLLKKTELPDMSGLEVLYENESFYVCTSAES